MNNAITYESLALRWSPRDKTDHAFNISMGIAVALFVLLVVILSSIELPEEARRTFVPLKEEIKIQIKQAPKPVPKVIEPPKPRESTDLRPKKEEVKPLSREEVKAREKVEKTGIFRLKDQLADLVDTASAKNVVNQNISQAGAGAQAAAPANPNILTAAAGKGSGGVSDSRHTVNVAPATNLAAGGQAAAGQVAQSAIKANPQVAGGKGAAARGAGVRADEDVITVLDQNKGTLNTLYRKARRSNPGLKGRLVLEITVQPSGEVSKVVIKSSELNDPTLEESIIARVKQLDFGVRKGGALTVVYPIEFLPG